MSRMMENESSRDSSWPFSPSLRDVRAAPGVDLSCCAGRGALSPIALHEAGHAVVARFLGLPIAGVTIIASADFEGLTFGLDTDSSHVTATALRQEAERRCNDAMTLLPLPGERRDCTASWLVHAQSLVIESMAGFAAKELAGFERELEVQSTDMAVARLYARTVVLSDSAVPAFIASCRADATQILKAHWHAVEAVATALDERKTLDGVEIDAVIYQAESKAMHQVELRRRECMAAMIAKAKSA
jgi:hypothetical protein